jgi:hypothetical protein
MQFRDHPLMSYRGVPNWPPVWTLARNGSVRILRGEVVVLTQVLSNSEMSKKCYLVIDFEGERFVGTLLCDDPIFCLQIPDILRRYIGRRIIDIGDLDVSHTL